MREFLVPDWIANSAAVVAAVSLLGLFLKLVGPWRKQISDTEHRLRKELMAERSRCEAELRVVRHRERGSRQIIYSLLHLFDMPAERREGALEVIRNTLADMERVEVMEVASIINVHREPEGEDA